jgi:NADPH:quinone reductase-like Zn-dependent oxidoreductase
VAPHSFPLVLGNDAAGVFEQTGPGVTRFKVGDRVFGQVMNVSAGQGSYAELAVASELAARAGAPVLATASSQAAADIGKLGAHHIIDYTKGNVAAQVQAICPAGVDAVLDLVSPPGAAGIDELATVIRPDGILVSTNHAAAVEALAARGIRGVNFSNTTTEGTLATLAEMADSGALRIHVDAEIALGQAPGAIASARTGHARGKTVIVP